jgi:hypothetical protein
MSKILGPKPDTNLGIPELEAIGCTWPGATVTQQEIFKKFIIATLSQDNAPAVVIIMYGRDHFVNRNIIENACYIARIDRRRIPWSGETSLSREPEPTTGKYLVYARDMNNQRPYQLYPTEEGKNVDASKTNTT